MNLLELLGIFFLAVIIVNIIVGVWAIKTALFNDKREMEVYTGNKST
jgi:hypothetical protein